MTRILDSRHPDALDEAARVLQAGGLIAVPTETVYGLAVLPNEAAIERLIQAKQRSAEKGIQLLIDSLDQARSVAVMDRAAELLAERWWPGPLTLVLARRADVELPAMLGGGRPTLGLRLPDHRVPRRLAQRLGPIAASSANISGEPDATTAQQVALNMAGLVELVVDDGPVRGGVPSSVVACLDDGPQVLREGAISAAEIAAVTARLGQP